MSLKFIVQAEVEADDIEAAQAIRDEMVGGAEDFAETNGTASASFGDAEPIEDERHAALVELARDRYAIGSDNEIEVDCNARISEGEDGIFVQGWLFIPNSELKKAGLVNPAASEEARDAGND